MKLFKRRGKVMAMADGGQAIANAAQSASARAVMLAASVSAAVEAAAGQWSRGLGAVRVEGAPNMLMGALGPEHFERAARDLLLTGNSLWRIEVAHRRVKLIEATTSYDVLGAPDPESWRYRLDLPGPDEFLNSVVPAAAVVHYRLPGGRPWRGLSPLAPSRRLDEGAQRAAEQESGKAALDLLPIGIASQEALAEQIDKRGLAGLLPAFVEPRFERNDDQWIDPASRLARGAVQPPSSKIRLGPDPTPAMVDLLAASQDRVLAAAGVPPALFDRIGGGGAGQREAWRRFLHGTLAPVGALIEAELRRKLDAPALTLTFDRLFASDLAGKARAFQSMINGGLEVERAAALAGLMEPDE